MPHRLTKPLYRKYARSMRAEATKAENMLWQALRGSKLEGLKFRRQVPLDGYILDFVCFEERLIVEVDGGQHAQSKRDEERDAYFRSQDFRTVRFWNDEVERNLDGVCLKIMREAGRCLSPPLRGRKRFQHLSEADAKPSAGNRKRGA